MGTASNHFSLQNVEDKISTLGGESNVTSWELLELNAFLNEEVSLAMFDPQRVYGGFHKWGYP